MNSPHRIRLRGPWSYQVTARTAGDADSPPSMAPPEVEAGVVQMPTDWGESLGADFRGRVRYRRAFHQPTGLTSRDRVDLVIEMVDAMAEVQLNGKHLGAVQGDRCPARFVVTPWLSPRNSLIIDVESPRATLDSVAPGGPERTGRPGGLIGEVRLEIFVEE